MEGEQRSPLTVLDRHIRRDGVPLHAIVEDGHRAVEDEGESLVLLVQVVVQNSHRRRHPGLARPKRDRGIRGSVVAAGHGGTVVGCEGHRLRVLARIAQFEVEPDDSGGLSHLGRRAGDRHVEVVVDDASRRADEHAVLRRAEREVEGLAVLGHLVFDRFDDDVAGRPRRAERDLPRHRLVVGTGQGGAVRGGVGYAQLGRGRRGQGHRERQCVAFLRLRVGDRELRSGEPGTIVVADDAFPLCDPKGGVARIGDRYRERLLLLRCAVIDELHVDGLLGLAGSEVDRCTPGFVVVPCSCRAVRCREVH